tara:strand:+ start:1655 stop:2017 length:363 start_codon:yes stop_codon:yes gene_type:complete
MNQKKEIEDIKLEKRKKRPNRCAECYQTYNRNFWNNYTFDLDLYNTRRTLEDWSQFHGHDRLNISVNNFVGNNNGHIPCNTWTLYIDEHMGEKEICLGEEMPIEQLEKFYEFLKVVLNKT